MCSIEDLCPLLNASSAFPLATDIARWSTFTPEEKMSFYSNEACHELHLFLHAHDPSFFAAHVAPIIANRLDPDFVDLFLMGCDISGYATVSRCERLNVCEKIILARAVGGGTGVAIALDVVRRCSALDVPKEDWKDSLRLNAAMSFGVFSRGVAEPAESSSGDDGTVEGEFKEAGGGGRAVAFDEEESNDAAFARSRSVAKKRVSAPSPLPKAAAPVMYQSVGKVKQIAEQRWKSVPKPSIFFRDLALHTVSCISSGTRPPFVSPFISVACSCALVALSFVSLPLSAAAVAKLQRRTQSGTSSLFLLSSGFSLRYFKDTVAIAPPPDTRTVIVGQHIVAAVFDPSTGWKTVTIGEQGCIIGRPYALRTIVTNVSESDVTVDVLTQIPSSAMPLSGTLHTNVRKLAINGFSVQFIDNWFFFPLAGSVSIYPAHVTSLSGECIGCASPMPIITVNSSFSVSADSSWPLIVTHGSDEQLVAALKSDLGLLRMRAVHVVGRLAQNRALLHSVLNILRENRSCVPIVWALALVGHIRDAAVEFLVDVIPPHIVASLVGTSLPLPIASDSCSFTVIRPSITSESGVVTGVCDFEPVFNARTHALGSYSTIAIEAMHKQYRRILWKVAADPAPVRSDCVQIACVVIKFIHTLCTSVLNVLNVLPCVCCRYLLALQDRFSEAWEFLTSLPQPGFVNAPAKHISELYLLAYLAMSHPDDAVLASVPSVMPVLLSRCVRPEWKRRVEVLQEQLTEAFESKARHPSASDLLHMRPHTARKAQVDAFAFSAKVRSESKTFVDLTACGLASPTTAFIKIFHLDIEVIFSNHPFLVAGRDNAIAAGSMFAAVAPHAVIEETMDVTGDSPCHRTVELPSFQLTSCFFLAVECNGIKTSQTVFKRCQQLSLLCLCIACTHSSSSPSDNARPAAWL